MSRGLIPTTVVVFACPAQLTIAVEDTCKAKFNWKEQGLLPGTLQAEMNLKLSVDQAEELVSELASFRMLYAEVLQFGKELGTTFMIAPGLGIFRAETNAAGQLMLSEDRVSDIVVSSAGNYKELQRLLRIALGQAWDDLLEPFRAARYADNIVLLNRAV